MSKSGYCKQLLLCVARSGPADAETFAYGRKQQAKSLVESIESSESIETSEFKRLRKDSRVGKTEKKLKDKFRKAHKPTGSKQVSTCFQPVGLCALLNLSFSFFFCFSYPTVLSQSFEF